MADDTKKDGEADATPPAKPVPRPIQPPKAKPAPKFGGYRVHVAGFGAWRAGDVVSAKDLTRANVDEDRLAQLLEQGVLSEVYS